MAPQPSVKITDEHFKWNYDAIDTLQVNKGEVLKRALSYMARPEEDIQFRS